MNARNLYLHYIISFLNNEYEIYHLLEKTYCCKSILGINSDSFYKVRAYCYQLIYTNNHCFVKSMKNDGEDETQKNWLEHYVHDNYDKIFNNLNSDMMEYIYEENNGIYKQKMFYIRKIIIEIKRNIFNKIIQNPNYYKKKYTAEDLFYICYSYVFSFLDNQSIILKNILYLIIHEKFDLNAINKEFMQHFSSKNQDSRLFNKLNKEIEKYNESDIQVIIEKFIESYHDCIYGETFVTELFQWKTKLTNMFVLIQQTFCFRILKNNENLILKIYHYIESEYIFDISIDDLDSILFLLSADCIFSLESFTEDTKLLLTKILNAKPNLNINIDVSHFYIKLYGYGLDELIDEGSQFNDFLLFLIDKTKGSIIMHIGRNKLFVQKYKNTNILELLQLDQKLLLKTDEFLLVSKKILLVNTDLLNYILRNLAHMIITSFINAENSEMQDILFHRNGRIQSSNYCNVFNFNFLSDQASTNNNQSDLSFDSIKTISFCGLKNSGSQLIGIENKHQKFSEFGFLGGVFDEKFSVIELNATFDPIEPCEIRNFIQKTSSLFYKYDSKNYTSRNMDQFFDIFDFQFIDKKYVIYHIHPECEIENFDTSLFNYKKRSKSDVNQLECYGLNEPKIVINSDINQAFKIYHNVSSTAEKYSPEIVNCHKFNLPNINLQNYFYTLEIKKSNFHVLISRIIELKSIDRQNSFVMKQLLSADSELKIAFCDVKFLAIDFLIFFDRLWMQDCKIEHDLYIDSGQLHKKKDFLVIENLRGKNSIFMDKFLEIQLNCTWNTLIVEKKQSFHEIDIFNASVIFFDQIPNTYTYLNISHATISVKDDLLIVNHTLLLKNIKDIMMIPNLYENLSIDPDNSHLNLSLKLFMCNLPQNLAIIGIYHVIEIVNCSSPFHINSFYSELKIDNHDSELSINGFITSAIPMGPTNRILKDKHNLILKNYEIDGIENITVHSIQIYECSIYNISNVKCKNLDIQNSECSFKLTTNQYKRQYSGISLNLEITEENDMMCIENCDIEK